MVQGPAGLQGRPDAIGSGRWAGLVLPILGAALWLLLVTNFGGGQRALGRMDPAYALPFLLPVILFPFWHWRGLSRRVRMGRYALFLIILCAVQAGLAVAMSPSGLGRLAPQMVVMLVAGGIAGGIAEVLDTLAKGRGLRLILLAVLAAPIWFFIAHGALAALYSPAKAAADAPTAIVLTGLPLRWSGSNDLAGIFAGEQQDDPALVQLQALGPLELVDSLADQPKDLARPWLLLHPRALAPAELVAIDAHVRGGGHAVIFADALSAWPAIHPLGDHRNPPITSLLTPLLSHWGIILDGVDHGKPDERWVIAGGYGLQLLSAGRFSRWPAACSAFADDYILGCAIGAGQVWIVGDADGLHSSLSQGPSGGGAHLLRSEVYAWTASKLWGAGSGQSLLKPIWMARQPG